MPVPLPHPPAPVPLGAPVGTRDEPCASAPIPPAPSDAVPAAPVAPPAPAPAPPAPPAIQRAIPVARVPSTETGRHDLLSQIRAGKKLRKAAAEEAPKPLTHARAAGRAPQDGGGPHEPRLTCEPHASGNPSMWDVYTDGLVWCACYKHATNMLQSCYEQVGVRTYITCKYINQVLPLSFVCSLSCCSSYRAGS